MVDEFIDKYHTTDCQQQLTESVTRGIQQIGQKTNTNKPAASHVSQLGYVFILVVVDWLQCGQGAREMGCLPNSTPPTSEEGETMTFPIGTAVAIGGADAVTDSTFS